KVDPVTRAYSPSKRIGSFVGFVPADKPKLTIAVIIDEPQGIKYGGVVAAPAFRGIAQNSLAYLKILPNAPAAAAAKPVDTIASPVEEVETLSDGEIPETPTEGEIMPNFKGM